MVEWLRKKKSWLIKVTYGDTGEVEVVGVYKTKLEALKALEWLKGVFSDWGSFYLEEEE